MIIFSPMTSRLGLIPQFLSASDPRPAVEQLHEAYAHGGGWCKFDGFELVKEGDRYALDFPGDPLMHEIAQAKLREEIIVVFDYSWVAVIQADGSYEIARMD